MQPVDVGHTHAFVDLVDGGVEDAELDHLRSHGRNEPAVGGATAGGELGRETGLRLDGTGHAFRQVARLRIERFDLSEGVTRTIKSETGLTPRSEEHTSELQSQSNLVCRLLLE